MDTAKIPTLAFVDCETTGLRPEQGHRPWEVAVILREPGLPDEEHVWQIRPNLDTADPVALDKGRFAERFTVPDDCEATWTTQGEGPWRLSAGEASLEIQSILRGAYVVAAVPAFDDSMLKALLHDRKLRIVWQYRLICVENLVAGALRLPVPPGLKDAADAMGVKYDPAELHTALGDARLARDVYDAVMGGAR